MKREYYSDSISNFISTHPDQIVGTLTLNSEFAVDLPQRDAWLQQISILQEILTSYEGSILIEFSVPRMGKRIDVVLIIGSVIFVLEFKIGGTQYTLQALTQVWDYALDLKNFHETSREPLIAPILVATEAANNTPHIAITPQNDNLLFPIPTNAEYLSEVIGHVLSFSNGNNINHSEWRSGRYRPTPTIVEAAIALYNNHSVDEIARNDASAINLGVTSGAVEEIILISKLNSQKSICFVTGVPGAGKTLIGLNVATRHNDPENALHSVFLSGNGPLVKVLTEALARDRVQREKIKGLKPKMSRARSEVKAFIQNVHHFRDECLIDETPPHEHVALFDEAQRAWNLQETANFMKQKKKRPNFDQSEPQFLISCLDRHPDWAVIVCLVGGGQEINRGEAGISEWVRALKENFPSWHIYISSRLTDSEYGAGQILQELQESPTTVYKDDLHLAVSMRSYRAENVSLLVKQILDLDQENARKTLEQVDENYPIVLTRDLLKAKEWLREKARGSERYGIVVSSQAERLKPHAIDVKSPIDPIHWFLDGPDDVRSSYYLEDVATEFHVQGLELDWTCVTWDADFRYSPNGWQHWSFQGSRWNQIHKKHRQTYLKNAYRVLLTRSRQGMAIVVPLGEESDPTRKAEFYDGTFDYLSGLGFPSI